MEYNQYYCLDCKSKEGKTEYKTGIGKSKEQLNQMVISRHTCRRCGSKKYVFDFELEKGSWAYTDVLEFLLKKANRYHEIDWMKDYLDKFKNGEHTICDLCKGQNEYLSSWKETLEGQNFFYELVICSSCKKVEVYKIIEEEYND